LDVEEKEMDVEEETEMENKNKIKKNFDAEEDLDQGWSVFQPPGWCKGHPSSTLKTICLATPAI